jgi:hypothetical protein
MFLLSRDIIKATKEKFPMKLMISWLSIFTGLFVTGFIWIYRELVFSGIFYLITALYPYPWDFLFTRLSPFIYTSFLPLIYTIESHLPLNTRGFFWKYGAIIMVIVMFLPRQISLLILSICYTVVFVPFTIIFVYYTQKNISGRIKYYVNALGFGILLVTIGELLHMDEIREIFGTIFHIFGSSIVIAGLIIFGIFALNFRSLEELEWKKSIQQLLIITKKQSIPIFSYNFGKEEKMSTVHSETIIAGGLFGINTVLKEISRSSKDINFIDHGDFVFIFIHGKNIIGLIFSNKFLEVLQIKLKKLVSHIESIYGRILENFEGEVSQFKGISSLMKDEFILEK